jgi:hypothetical protein
MKRTIFALAFFTLTLQAFGQEVFKPEGTYQLNLAKSAIHGPIVKTMTTNVGNTVTVLGFDANGKPYTAIFPFIVDGKPHPIMGSPTYDTEIDTQLNPYTISISRTKDGKVIQTGISIHNPTLNTTTLAIAAADGSYSHVLVYEKLP